MGVTVPEGSANTYLSGLSFEVTTYEATSATHHQLCTSMSLGVSAFYDKTPSVEASPPRLIRSGCVQCWLLGGYLGATWQSLTSRYLLFMLI